jgi:hypothetical protein
LLDEVAAASHSGRLDSEKTPHLPPLERIVRRGICRSAMKFQ